MCSDESQREGEPWSGKSQSRRADMDPPESRECV